MQPISTILSKNPRHHTSDLSAKRNGTFFNGLIQPKLTMNQPNVQYEREADVVAEQVMRMPANENGFFRAAPNFILRKCAHCEEEQKDVHMKSGSNVSNGATASPTVHDVINSPGQSLDDGTRNLMESRFGYDFGKVQIHNDSLAHQSSAEINALAYTHGNHITFGVGQYQPHTNAGKQLLAHELVHVIQQNSHSAGSKSVIQRDPDKDDAVKAVTDCPTFVSMEAIVKSSSVVSDACKSKCRLELGCCTTERGSCGSTSGSGSVIKAAVDIPDKCEGVLGFKQNVLSTDRKRTLKDKSEECVTVSSVHADGGTPWKGCKLEITKPGRYTIETDDCPNIILDDAMVKASAKDSFKMFLLWKKKGESSWMPIANVNWAWNASTNRKKGDDCASSWATPSGKSTGGKGGVSGDMPVSKPDIKDDSKWVKCSEK